MQDSSPADAAEKKKFDGVDQKEKRLRGVDQKEKRLHDVHQKRKVLVAEDEAVNREIMGAVLSRDYDVIYAENGIDALERIQENKDILSIILLDLIMPGMSGREVLLRVKADPELSHIPVIVASGDEAQEIECLQAGASDFIKKPYPDGGVILARVLRTIELSEGRQLINSTERDPLTGLYTKEFFYSYANQFDHYHKNTETDAIVLDIEHFSILNERYGRAYADTILRRVGEKAREMVHENGGIVCRRESDVFLIYCPHRDDYKSILDIASSGLDGEDNASTRVRLRMGVYPEVDKTLEMEHRFDRAKAAADSVRSSFTRNIGIYDDSLHKAELYSEQLIEEFPKAIEEHQFKVFFQPKFDIKGDEPVLCGAEGLVRWMHPELGMINPGIFIPLFEDNGLIQLLDHYVWREAAEQIRKWKDEFGICVPISVNASRIDMYDPGIVYTLQEILNDNGLEPADVHLEVTESAYSEEPQQIIEMVKKLRLVGHKIEMDDFGTGYSSLNMLSEMPIDVLKLDMKFIRTAFSGERDTHMIEVIIGIAGHMHVPVVAEGVETEEQITALKDLGCDIVQGYYFSPPVPPDEFARFLKEKNEYEDRQSAFKSNSESSAANKDEGSGHFDRLARKWPFSIRKAGFHFITLSVLIAVLLFVTNIFVNNGYEHLDKVNNEYIVAQQAASNMSLGSDYLTECVRNFVITGDQDHLEDYFTEANVTKRRDKAVADVRKMMDDPDSKAAEHLSAALDCSNELMEYEYHAMRLIIEDGDYAAGSIPEEVSGYKLSGEEKAMSREERKEMAEELVYGDDYNSYKDIINENTTLCTEEILEELNKERSQLNAAMDKLLLLQSVLTVLFILTVSLIILFIVIWIRDPLMRIVKLMKARKSLPSSGAEELRYVAETYNEVFHENIEAHNKLSYEANHDALTGLLNRSAYDLVRTDIEMGRNALILVDVDKFKQVNDVYGHDVGDLVLVNVAEHLQDLFSAPDMVFRIGGDEFVVIAAMADSSMAPELKSRIERLNMDLQKPTKDIPGVSLSVGIAFTDRDDPEGDIFKDADTALYRVKNSGRNGCSIY